MLFGGCRRLIDHENLLPLAIAAATLAFGLAVGAVTFALIERDRVFEETTSANEAALSANEETLVHVKRTARKLDRTVQRVCAAQGATHHALVEFTKEHASLTRDLRSIGVPHAQINLRQAVRQLGAIRIRCRPKEKRAFADD